MIFLTDFFQRFPDESLIMISIVYIFHFLISCPFLYILQCSLLYLWCVHVFLWCKNPRLSTNHNQASDICRYEYKTFTYLSHSSHTINKILHSYFSESLSLIPIPISYCSKRQIRINRKHCPLWISVLAICTLNIC